MLSFLRKVGNFVPKFAVRAVKGSRITRKLVFHIFAFSIVLTVISSSIQLWNEWQRELDGINSDFNRIRTGYTEAIAETLWVVDSALLETLLKGILSRPHVESVSITGSAHDAQFGEIKSAESIATALPLMYPDPKNPSQTIEIGKLNVTMGLEGVKHKVIESALTIVLTRAGTTFLEVLILFILFHILVARHLLRIYRFLTEINVEAINLPRLELKRNKASAKDELDHITESINAILEKLQHHTTRLSDLIKERTQQIFSILENIKQGIFTILPDETIHSLYSKFLENILEETDIAGKNASQVLFTRAKTKKEIIERTSSALTTFLGEPLFSFEANQHLLLTRFERLRMDGSISLLHVDWNPISDDGVLISKVMVTIRDLSEVTKLQEAATLQRRELEMIREVIHIPPEEFASTVDQAQKLLDNSIDLLDGAASKDPEIVDAAFRNLHTLKGIARHYALDHLVHHVRESEAHLRAIRENPQQSWNIPMRLAELRRMKRVLEEYQGINDTKLARGTRAADGTSAATLTQLVTLVRSRMSMATDPGEREFLTQVDHILRLTGAKSVVETLASLVNRLGTLAQSLEKPEPVVNVQDQGVLLVREVQGCFKETFLHLLSNSLDHGIEAPADRKRKGKNVVGTITIRCHVDRGKLIIVFCDDGAGLNLARIRAKGMASGLIPRKGSPSDQEIAELIFSPGLSTKEQVTDVSGQGVGLDAVKSAFTKLGGDIRIELGELAGGGNRAFSFVLELPSPYFLFSL